MARGRSTDDTATLQMALVGYQIEKDKIETRIKEIQSQLKGKKTTTTAAAPVEKASGSVKRMLSPEARKRIAAAQKKRWAEHRRAKAQQGKSE